MRGEVTAIGFGHALEDGVVFAVDRQQGRPPAAHGLHEEAPGHDQGLLVGEQDALAARAAARAGLSPAAPTIAAITRVHFGQAGHLLQGPLAAEDLGLRVGEQVA